MRNVRKEHKKRNAFFRKCLTNSHGACASSALACFLFFITACTNKANLTVPTFSGITVVQMSEVSYTTQATTLNLNGVNTYPDSSPLTTIRFYSDSNCTQTLGEGLVSSFESSGIQITVPTATAITSIFGNTPSDPACQFVVSFDPVHSPPPAPTFSSYNPSSPSSTSHTPYVFGSVSGVTLTVNFYNNASCSGTMIGTGSANQFTTVGIALSLSLATTNTIYAQALEPFGNPSPCTAFPSFVNTESIPAAPSFTQITPVSPNASAIPTLSGTVGTSAQLIKFYSDSACSQLLTSSSTLASAFAGTGISVTVPSNASTSIYSETFDSNNNPSLCTLLTVYVNNQLPPLPAQMASTPTPTPYPALYVPSPPNLTLNPQISGVLPSSDTATVNLYSDSACTQALGSGSASQFKTTGVTITVIPDTSTETLTSITPIYSKTVDYAGNSSACTYLTTYVYDSLPPANPPSSAPNPVTGYFSNPKTFNNIQANPTLYVSTTDDTATVAIYADDPTCSSTGNPDGSSSLVGSRTLLSYETPDVFNSGGIDTILSYGANHATRVPDTSTQCTVNGFCKVLYQYHGIFYGKAYDQAGNATACQLLMTYDFSNEIPVSPIASSPATLPVSPTNASYKPIMKGTISDITLGVEFFDCTGVTVDTTSLNTSSSCVGSGTTNRCRSIGTGTAQQFDLHQIIATVNQNAETPIYGVAYDEYGNYSYCQFFANYIDTTISPSPPNGDLAFALPSPTTRLASSLKQTSTSPNQWVTSSGDQLTLTGTVGINPNRVVDPNQMAYTIVFYNSNSCSTKMGSGTVTSTVTSGSTVSEATTWTYQVTTSTSNSAISAANSLYIVKNSTNAIYAEVWDNAGAPTSNHSSCTLVASIVEDEQVPGVPTITSNSTNPSITKPLTLNGSIASNTDLLAPQTLTLYNTSTCTSGASVSPFPYVISLNPDNASTVNPSLWTTSWSQLTVPGTTDLPIIETIPIYGQTTNIVGTLSACQPLFNFVHDNEGAAITSLSVNSNGSVTVNWDSNPNNSNFNVTTTYTLYRSTQAQGPFSIVASTNTTSVSNVQLTLGSFTDTTTQNNGTYYYVIGTTNSTGVSNFSNQVSEYYVKYTNTLIGNVTNQVQIGSITAPSAPTGLIASAGIAQINLSWTASSNALTYAIWRATKTGGPYTRIVNLLDTTTYQDSGLTNGTAYYYVVTASNVGGTSPYSNEVNVLPQGFPADSPTLLTASWNLSSGCNNGNGCLVLNWGANSYYNTFDVYASSTSGGESSSGSGTTVYTTGSSSTSYQISSIPTLTLSNDNAIYLQVSPNWGLTSGSGQTFSNEVVVHWNKPVITAYPGQNKVVLHITGTGNEPHYILKRGNSSGGPYTNTVINTSGLTYTPAVTATNTPGYWTYTDSTVNTTSGYYYVLVPQYDTLGAQLGIPSNETQAYASSVAATNPTNLSLGSSAYSASASVNLTWTPPQLYNYAVVYRCSSTYYSSCIASNTSSNWTAVYTSPLNQIMNSYQDSNIANGSYLYLVATYWGGTASYSNVAYFYNTQVSSLSTSILSASSIKVTWSAGTAAAPSGQQLYYTVSRSSTSGGPFTALASGTGLSSSTLTFTDTTVTSATSTTYYYQISTMYRTSSTTYTNGTLLGYGFASAQTNNTPTATPSPASTLVAPSNVTVTSTASGSINLAWSKTLTGSSYYTGYYLYYVQNTSASCPSATNPSLASFNTAYPNVLTLSSTATTANVTGLNAGSNYCFVLSTYYYKPATTSPVAAAVTTYSTTSSAISAYTYSSPSSPPSISSGNCGTNAAPSTCIIGTWNDTGSVSSISGITYTLQRSSDPTFNTGVTNVSGYTAVTPSFPATFTDSTASSSSTLYFYRTLVNYPYTYAAASESFTYASSVSNGISPGIVPTAPTGLSATQSGDGTSITFTWTAASDAKGYNLYLVNGTSVAANGSNLTLPSPAPASTTPVTPLISSNSYTMSTSGNYSLGTPFTIAVSSLNDSAESTYTSLNLLTVYPMASPAAPSVTTIHNTSNVITWSAISGITSYTLQRASNGNADLLDFSTLTTLNLASVTYTDGTDTTVTYTDSTVTPGQSYYYRFIPNFTVNGSVIAGNYSAVSASVTPGSSLTSSTVVGALEAPQNLAAISVGTSIVLTWTAVPDAIGYNIYRSTSSSNLVTPSNLISSGGTPAYPSVQIISPATAPLTTYTDTNITTNTTYYYAVTSVNGSNVESLYNTASLPPLSVLAGNNGTTAGIAPTLNSATATNNQIVLSWSSVSGATSYFIKRQTDTLNDPSAPFEIVSTTANGSTLTYTDTDLENSIEYTYKVAANLSSGAISPDSSPLSATAIATLNLSVPIELTDQPLASNASSAITFERTQTSLDPSAYDGTLTYDLEIFASNSDSSPRFVYLYDASGNPISGGSSISVPANTTTPTRFRQAIHVDASANVYRLNLDQTSSNAQLMIYSARLWVNQVGATKTKIYIPLLSSSNTALAGSDLNAPLASTESSAGYSTLPNASIFIKQLASYYETAYQHLDDNNPWQLEAIVAAGGTIGQDATVGLFALVDASNSNAIVYDTETEFTGNELTSSSTNANTSATPIPVSGGYAMQPTLTQVPFEDGVENFSDSVATHSFQISLQCSSFCSNSVSLYKAGLWMKLVHLNQVNILLRTSMGSQLSLASIDGITGSNPYSNPKYFFQATTNLSNASPLTLNLMDNGANDTQSGSASSITSLTPINTTPLTAQQTLSSDISTFINPLHRFFITPSNAVSGDTVMDTELVIQANRMAP